MATNDPHLATRGRRRCPTTFTPAIFTYPFGAPINATYNLPNAHTLDEDEETSESNSEQAHGNMAHRDPEQHEKKTTPSFEPNGRSIVTPCRQEDSGAETGFSDTENDSEYKQSMDRVEWSVSPALCSKLHKDKDERSFQSHDSDPTSPSERHRHSYAYGERFLPASRQGSRCIDSFNERGDDEENERKNFNPSRPLSSRLKRHRPHERKRSIPNNLTNYQDTMTLQQVYCKRTFTSESSCSHNQALVQDAVHIPLPPTAPYGVHDILSAIRETDIEIRDYTLIKSPSHLPKSDMHLLEVGLDCRNNCLRLAGNGLVVCINTSSTSSTPSSISCMDDDDHDRNSHSNSSKGPLEEHRLQVLLPRSIKWRKLMRVKITGVRSILRRDNMPLSRASATATVECLDDDGCFEVIHSIRTSSSCPSISMHAVRPLIDLLRRKLGHHREIISVSLLGVQTATGRFVHSDEAEALVCVYFWDRWMVSLAWCCCLRPPALTASARYAHRQARLLKLQWIECVEVCPADQRAQWTLCFWLLVISCMIVFILS